jgi:ferrous iron transport protein A
VRRLQEFDLPVGAPVEFADAAPLSAARKGFSGVITEVRPAEASGGLGGVEIERRLLEMGLVEGAPVQVLYEGLFGRDPIAVKLADRTVALRRREARAVLVRPVPAPAKAGL